MQRECKRHGKKFSEFREIYKPKKEPLQLKASSAIGDHTIPPTRNDPPVTSTTGGELTEKMVESDISELIQRERCDPRVAQVAVAWLEKKNALTTSSNESTAFQLQKEMLHKVKKEMFS